MNKEIRIYYESYEQAKHYIKTMIASAFTEIEIKLVRLCKSNNFIENSLISRILLFKNPDILISFVMNEVEVPLFVIEFSEAVTTEDHELQRFDGYLGAVAGHCIYVKISPNKKSQSEHGGNLHFDTFEPYALIYQRFGLLSYHFEWPLASETYVKRNQEYFSCPPPIEEFNCLLIEVINCIVLDSAKVMKEGLSCYYLSRCKNKTLKGWVEKLSTHKLIDNSQSFASSRLRWLKKEKALLFKFNRMGHGMDPERGMIWYYKLRYDKPIVSRIIFPSTGDKVFKQCTLKNNYEYLNAFMIGTSLNKNDKFIRFLKKNKYITNAKLILNKIDITEFLLENIQLMNKQLLSIFYNSVKFIIQDEEEKNRVVLYWNKKINLFNEKVNTKSTTIKKRNFMEEDDVSYVVAHQVLKANGFKIISLSYPGAQGDRAILPQAGTGRRQSRKYIDIVSYYPKRYLSLTENKGTYSLPAVSEDIEKLHLYRSDDDFKQALNNLVDKISPENKDLPILLSVSFCVPVKKTNLKGLPIQKINFFITISPDIRSWKVWVGGDLQLFKHKEGSVELDETFYVE